MSDILGKYDMVLALSSNKINSLLHRMHRKGKIHEDWAFLASSTTPDIVHLTGEEVLTRWTKMDRNKETLDSKSEELSSIIKQMQANEKKSDSPEKNKKRLELVGKIGTASSEEADARRKVEEDEKLDIGLIAKIDAPEIEILDESRKELLLKINFRAGSKLLYSRKGKRSEHDLGSGTSYAFRVSIAQIRKTSDTTTTIITNGKKEEVTLKDQGINDSEFTIEALFLDFENANITAYNESKSTLPEEIKRNGALQLALNNYFKNLKDSKNPYVLGYAINKKKIAERERPLLYPAKASFSTSYSSKNRASALNFLMLLKGHKFPSNGGKLPRSLMEDARDTTAAVSGVFGLSLHEFESTYTSLLLDTLCKRIKENMGSKCKSIQVNGKDINIEFGWPDVKDGKLDLIFTGSRNSADNDGVDILRYRIKASACAHEEIAGLGNLVGLEDTTGVDWNVSTDGRIRYTGKEGSLTVKLKAGTRGKLEITLNYSNFRLGFGKVAYKSATDEAWNVASEAAGSLLNMVGIATDIGKGLDDLRGIESIGDTLNIQNIESLERRVILPVASVYTYKNVRLAKGSSSSDSALLFDVAYAPFTQT